MSLSIVRPLTKHTESIAAICAAGWRQTVEGKLSEEYKTKNVDLWYKPERVHRDIQDEKYSYVALIDGEVVC